MNSFKFKAVFSLLALSVSLNSFADADRFFGGEYFQNLKATLTTLEGMEPEVRNDVIDRSVIKIDRAFEELSSSNEVPLDDCCTTGYRIGMGTLAGAFGITDLIAMDSFYRGSRLQAEAKDVVFTTSQRYNSNKDQLVQELNAVLQELKKWGDNPDLAFMSSRIEAIRNAPMERIRIMPMERIDQINTLIRELQSDMHSFKARILARSSGHYPSIRNEIVSKIQAVGDLEKKYMLNSIVQEHSRATALLRDIPGRQALLLGGIGLATLGTGYFLYNTLSNGETIDVTAEEKAQIEARLNELRAQLIALRK